MMKFSVFDTLSVIHLGFYWALMFDSRYQRNILRMRSRNCEVNAHNSHFFKAESASTGPIFRHHGVSGARKELYECSGAYLPRKAPAQRLQMTVIISLCHVP